MTAVDTLPRGIPLFDPDIDADTAALIAKLTLEDLEKNVSAHKGKGRDTDALSDARLALELQSEYLRHQLALVEDEKYARSLASALETDAAFLHAHQTAEQAAEEDHRVAELVSRGEPLPPQTAAQAHVEDPAFVLEPPVTREAPRASGKLPERYDEWRDTATLCHDSDDEDAGTEPVKQRVAFEKYARHNGSHEAASSSKTIINGSRKSKWVAAARVECISCSEDFDINTVLHVPCDHYYCRDCVTTLVDLFTRDESLYPLRCCQKYITVSAVLPFLSSKLRAVFEAKNAEFSVLSKDRVYCFQPTCSEFLGSSQGLTCRGIVCPTCSQSTCPRCKQAAHEEEDCAVNAAATELRALARAQGWQTCPGCHTLIELNMGCYHMSMTCRCRTEFCYLCAARWKSCECPQWEENRLIAAAEERVENEVGARAARVMEPVVFWERVQERARALRVNHDCEQHRWMYRHGGGTCSECRYTLPSYLLICRGCSLLACVRCSRNRF